MFCSFFKKFLDQEILELVDRVASHKFKLDNELCGKEIDCSSPSLPIAQSNSNLESLDLASPFSNLTDHKSIEEARMGRYMYFKTHLNRTVSSLSLGDASIKTEDLVPELRASVRNNQKKDGTAAEKLVHEYLNADSVILRHVNDMKKDMLHDGKEHYNEDVEHSKRKGGKQKKDIPLYMNQYDADHPYRVCQPDQLVIMRNMLSRHSRQRIHKNTMQPLNIYHIPDKAELFTSKLPKDPKPMSEIEKEKFKKQRRIERFMYDHKPSSAFESLLQEVLRSEKKKAIKNTHAKLKEREVQAKFRKRMSMLNAFPKCTT